jgi:tRNA(Ile)-lysidine synthase
MELLDRVRRTIRRHDLARTGTRVVVALSGGSDSTALAHLLRELHDACELQLVGLAHFNHQLRPTALRDERFSEAVAASLGRAIVIGRENVGRRARRDRQSLEQTARRARHEFLERARLHFEADVVALGHTRDDQAETFLMRLMRGAGPRGLAAMHPRRASLIRPLLECRRAELQRYLRRRGLTHVHDETNDDVRILRNRVRAELLPLLERKFNPSIVDALADEAEVARADWEWMEASVDRMRPLAHRDVSGWRVDADALRRAPVALARLVVRRAMVELAPDRAVTFEHVQAVLDCAASGGVIDLPGQRVQRLGSELVLTRRVGRAVAKDGTADFSYPLSIPGEVALSDVGYVVTVEPAVSGRAAGLGAVLSNGTTALVRRDHCVPPLTVRNRRPGDRFRPLGLRGRKKLQDFFVDRKVARLHRDRVPIVVDGADRIVWVAGHAIDHEFRVTDPAQAVLILRLKQV